EQQGVFTELDCDIAQSAKRSQAEAAPQCPGLALGAEADTAGGEVAAAEQDQGVDQACLRVQGGDAGTEHLLPVAPGKGHAAEQQKEGQQFGEDEAPHGQVTGNARGLRWAQVGETVLRAVHQMLLPVSSRQSFGSRPGSSEAWRISW